MAVWDDDDLGYDYGFVPAAGQDEAPEPYWTARRIIFLGLVLLTLVAFLVYTLWFLFEPAAPPPPPPTPPLRIV